MITRTHIRDGQEIQGRKKLSKRAKCRLRRKGRTYAEERARKVEQKRRRKA